jgi:hypothetical protein
MEREMKGFRFYAEMTEARRSKHGSERWLPFTRKMLREENAAKGHLCNCVAVFLQDDNRPLYQSGGNIEALAPVYDVQNAPVCVTGVSRGYLADRCVRIDAETARKLHPALFASLA